MEGRAPTPSFGLDKRALFEDLGYRPHPGQAAIHRSTASRRILACGVRWGKSTCATLEGVAAALQPCERSLGWVVGPTYELAARVFREIEEPRLFRSLAHLQLPAVRECGLVVPRAPEELVVGHAAHDTRDGIFVCSYDEGNEVHTVDSPF